MTQRREFLTLCGMLAAGSVATPHLHAASLSTASRTKKRVLVIGAGMAGLSAARELQQHDYEVIVIEGRNRIGGRIWTSHEWNDMPVDLGASWIHGVRGNPLSSLADQIQAKRLKTSYQRAATYGASGELLTEAQENALEEIDDAVSDLLEKAQQAENDVSILQAIQPLLKKYDPTSNEYRFIHFVVNGKIEQEYSGSARDLSSHWYDSAKGFDGGDVLFADGFGCIIEHLSRDIEIHQSQIVQRIEWESSQVRVTTNHREFTADHAIVTLPLGVLKAKKVQFSPELPSEKLQAIEKLGMGVLNKCYLQFEDAFWPDDVDWLEYVSPRPGEWTEWVSLQRAAEYPILMGFNAADQGKAIEAHSDATIVASAMKTLRILFGKDIPDPIDSQITRWASDPFAFGSYSFNAIGSTPKMRSQLATPLGKSLFFAGEATERNYFGTAHGAHLSGLRAAKEIMEIS